MKPEFPEHKLRLLIATQHDSRAYINILKTDINPNYMYSFIPHRAVSTLRIGYENQPVSAVYKKNRCYEIDTKHINSLCTGRLSFFRVKTNDI